MYDLGNFYQSKEWRSLLATLKMERLNENGEIICEYCGKPITKAYDIIGHHKTELTDENVNDFNVSLNPTNVSFVHHRCHNYIHNKLGYSVRHIFLVYGPPLAGKTTYVRNNADEGDLIIDMDNIWECISGCDRYVKPNRLKSIAFMIRDDLLNAVKYRQGKWNSAYIIGGYPLKSERERLCRELGAREIYIQASHESCLEKLAGTQDKRHDMQDAWKTFIDDWFERFSE